MINLTGGHTDIWIGLSERKHDMVQEDDAAVCIIGVIININPGIIVSLKEWFNLNKRRWLASSSVLYFMNQNYKISLLNGVGSLEHLHHLERLT